jgi:hypothetical protein
MHASSLLPWHGSRKQEAGNPRTMGRLLAIR